MADGHHDRIVGAGGGVLGEPDTVLGPRLDRVGPRILDVDVDAVVLEFADDVDHA